MGAKEIISSLSKVVAASPVGKYAKYLNPYTPAKIWAENGKKEYVRTHKITKKLIFIIIR